MTIKDAFKQWSMMRENMTLAQNSRHAVKVVLLNMWGNTELADVTREKANVIFSASTEIQEYRTKAASILAYLMQWGAEKGYCQKPDFDYTIANGPEQEEKQKPEKSEKPVLAKKKRTLRQVAQIDPETLQVIKTYDSRTQASQQSGALNLTRAIERRGMAGGYFWAYADEVADFKPKYIRGTAPKPPTPRKIPQSLLADYTDQELIDEMRRRGWQGTLTITTSVAL